MRVAYLCGSMHQLADLAPNTPPWAVSLPAQVAAVRALEHEGYYSSRYRETRGLREQLIAGLRRIGIEEIVPSAANFVMFHLGPRHPPAAAVLTESRKRNVYLRDVAPMGSEVGPRAVRIAVKDAESNQRTLATLEEVLRPGSNRG
jgi:histidinol-phosphate/aromatic aminotransferase/cobyric acid decarboxylase-like protein